MSGRLLLGRASAPGFRRRVVVLEPGDRHRFRAEQWQGALVLVDSGAIHLVCEGEPPQRFVTGDLLSLGGLKLTRTPWSSGTPSRTRCRQA